MRFNLGLDLFEACQSGDLERVQEVLEKGAPEGLEWRDRMGWTPLHAAVEAKNIEIIQRLIRAGAQINSHNGWGDTPLHIALHMDLEECPLENGERKSRLELTRVLLDLGADPQAVGSDNTPCWGLARLYQAKEVERLLAQYIR